MTEYDVEHVGAVERAVVWAGCVLFCAGFWLLAGPLMWDAVLAAWRVMACPPLVCG